MAAHARRHAAAAAEDQRLDAYGFAEGAEPTDADLEEIEDGADPYAADDLRCDADEDWNDCSEAGIMPRFTLNSRASDLCW